MYSLNFSDAIINWEKEKKKKKKKETHESIVSISGLQEESWKTNYIYKINKSKWESRLSQTPKIIIKLYILSLFRKDKSI